MSIRLYPIACLPFVIAANFMRAAIATPLAEITLNDTPIENQAIAAGSVRVVIRNYQPLNYEHPDSSDLSYEVYVNNDLKAQERQSVDFIVGDISLEHLDPDAVPEVIFHRFTGGAHCCSIYRVYSWQGDRLHQLQTYPLDAAAAGDFTDLDNDGYSEFLTADGRFLYAFGSYASSWPPSIVLSFRNGTLIDVTRQFPERLRSQAYQMYEATRDSSPNSPTPGANSILAGYVAQKILLGEYASGWDYMLAHYNAIDDWGLTTTNAAGAIVQQYADYPTALSAFLRDLNYLTATKEPNPELNLSPVIIERESAL